MSNKWNKSRPLLIIEFLVWGAILVWFLTTFLPHGIH